MRQLKKVAYGNAERRSFSKIKEVMDIPYLIEAQKKSYESFLQEGIKEVLTDFTPIVDFSNKKELRFLEHILEDKPKYTEKESKDKDVTYCAPLKVKVRLTHLDTGESIDQDVFMGDFPLMTPNGSFVINGAERVVVSQLVRSPGVYFGKETDVKTGVAYYGATCIPSRGAWLEFQEDNAGVLYIQVDRTRKLPATVFMKVMSAITKSNFGSKDKIAQIFNNEKLILETLTKDITMDEDDAILELNRRLRPGEVANVEQIKSLMESLFYDRKKYDLTKIGRYKFNKKLSIAARLQGQTLASDIVDSNGVLQAKAGEILTVEKAKAIQNAGINNAKVKLSDGREFEIVGNNQVRLEAFGIDGVSCGIDEYVYYPNLQKVLESSKKNKSELQRQITSRKDELLVRFLTVEDVISAVNYIIGLRYGIGNIDNIDHLGNRRVRSVGELLQNQFRVGVTRLERVIKERMLIQSESEMTPQSLINIRPVSSAIKEFFGSSQLSQFMDEANPIAELTHKRKLSALGPGGLNRDRASFDVRDVHYTHYSRLCPIETPEGQNIGLISSLSTYSRINSMGFIEAPYRKVDKLNKKVTDKIDYLSADEEDKYIVAQANETLDANSWFESKRVAARHKEEILELDRELIDYMDVNPRQLVSVATALIPFLENDDTNRALMGSNMQRQAVPLLRPESPIVGTGMEHKVAYDSGVMVIARKGGTVEYVSADEIKVKESNDRIASYTLRKFIGSNQGTCINQRPIVKKGDKVVDGAVLADGHSTENTELALGRNILVGFMAWEGYNYEDAILISEKLLKDDVFTSIHIEEHEMEARDTKLGEEEITRDIPNVGDDALADLDEYGIIRVGAEVRSGDILVGKVTPKGETELTPEERLLRAIFGEKSREVRDTSLRVPHGEGGIVVDVKIFTRANKDEMSPGVHKLVRVYIAQKRKISVGDKMAGRHGNKGVISRILSEEDMPFLADGTSLEIVLNPLGVPSRMNIGQVLEVHLGLVAKTLGWKIATPVFDGAKEQDIKQLLNDNGFVGENGVDGKIELFDGRTGEPFENRVTVGSMYMLKLVHLVDDKIHARSTGPYSLVTQQPLGGKAQFGGQRFGEMEVWALYAYGAASILQEIMTVKSDDVAGRVKTYESIVKGIHLSEPGVPESFKVLIKELQSLALDVKVLSDQNVEIGISDLIEDEIENEAVRGKYKQLSQAGSSGFDEVQFDNDNFKDDLEIIDEDSSMDYDLFGEDEGLNLDDAFEDRIMSEEELASEDEGL
ncbi:MAG: DNA-directed RNA polymerase subunit beta [Clostridiales bacterium]|jgi:DNA-directed RNA polymerase subunit beta|nr:DNA-directed RNA polymerase subunit beta [Clostridiales bacterium]